MKCSVLLLATLLLLTMPVTWASMNSIEINDTDSGYVAPPTGYYYDPVEPRWYYYDGVLLTPQDRSFTPPPGAGWTFEIQHYETETSEGFELVIDMKFIGAHTLHYLIEYEFGLDGRRVCPDPDRTPVCIHEDDRASRNFLIVPSTVLSTIQRTVTYPMAKPNTGIAEAWGWLDATSYPKDATTVADGPLEW